MFFENFIEESKSNKPCKWVITKHFRMNEKVIRILLRVFLNMKTIQKRIGWQEAVRCEAERGRELNSTIVRETNARSDNEADDRLLTIASQ